MLILYIMDISFNTPFNKSYNKYEGVERKKSKTHVNEIYDHVIK